MLVATAGELGAPLLVCCMRDVFGVCEGAAEAIGREGEGLLREWKVFIFIFTAEIFIESNKMPLAESIMRERR